MELALTTIPSLFKQAEQEKNNPIIKQALERLESYIALGLTKGIEQAKKGVLSSLINSKGMRLIEIYNPFFDRYDKKEYNRYRINNIDIDGSSKQLTDDPWWRYQPLQDFVENKNSTAIPLEALKRITSETKDKLGVFYRVNIDPILVYPLDFKSHYYITYSTGLFKSTKEKVPVNLPGFGSMFIALRQWD